MSKPSRKTPSRPPAPPAVRSRGKTTLVVSAVGIAVAAILVLLFIQSDRAEPVATPGSSATPVAAQAATTTAQAQQAVLKPHEQKEYPPLQLPGYPLGRSPEVIKAAYLFAAE